MKTMSFSLMEDTSSSLIKAIGQMTQMRRRASTVTSRMMALGKRRLLECKRLTWVMSLGLGYVSNYPVSS